MTTETTIRTHTIDAAGKRLGKVATEAATVLMGKDQVDFAKHTVTDVKVTIENASKLDVTEKKKGEIYQSYSGYPGGRKTETLEHLGTRLGYAEVVRRTVKGMLPKNKLQAILMKNLEVTE
jgi:large subunit ribosomal protein L13